MAEAGRQDVQPHAPAPSRLQYVYLLRVPLLIAVSIVCICLFAFITPARLVLGNTFDVESSWGIFFISLTAFIAAWVVMVTWRLIRLYGATRYLGGASLRIPANLRIRDPIYYSVIAFPVVIGAIWKTGGLPWYLEIAEAALGLLASLLCLACVDVLQRWLTRADFARRPGDDAGQVDNFAGTSPALVFPAGIPPLERLGDRLGKLNPTPSWFLRAVENLCRLVPKGIGHGYLDYDEQTGRFKAILPGHVTAFVLLFSTLVVYLLVGAADLAFRVEKGQPPIIPTLSYVMLLAMLLCWVFSGLAFFFDRYRIPVLIPLAAWLIFTSYFPGVASDYYYPVIKPVEPGASTVATQSSGEHSIIVVAANGGGIQSAAWTARVLTGLQEECDEVGCSPDFARSIKLISSASGGSVGAMYFVNEYTEEGLPEDDLQGIVRRSEASSLDQISWGLLYPDLGRTLFPNPFARPQWDRGRALEEAWSRGGGSSWEDREGIQEGLLEWKRDTQEGWRPAVIFNTTNAESGERVPLATTDLPEGSSGRITYEKLFGNTGRDHDIAIVTAARLSSAFPFISPAARADVEGQAPHLVDGGYYDNYGISSLVEWLDAELEMEDNTIDRVLVIEIRGAPSPSGYTYEGKQDCPPRPGAKPPDRKTIRGWLYQAYEPANTIFRVRNTGQRTHNDVELELLKDKWRGDVKITRALFEYDSPDTPLSWHLTKGDKEEIEKHWKAELDRYYNTCAGWNRVRTFLTDKEATNGQ